MLLPFLFIVTLVLQSTFAALNTLSTCVPGAVFASGTTFYYAATDVQEFNMGFGVYAGPCSTGSVATVVVTSPTGTTYTCNDVPLDGSITDTFCPGVIRGTMDVGQWTFILDIGTAGMAYAGYSVTHTQVTVEAATPTVIVVSTPTSFIVTTSTSTIINTAFYAPAYVTSASATARRTSTIKPSTILTISSTRFYTRTSVIRNVATTLSTRTAKCTSLGPCAKRPKFARAAALNKLFARDWTPSGPLTTTTTPPAFVTTVMADTIIFSTDTAFTDTTTTTTLTPTPATITIFFGVTTATITLPTSTRTRYRITTSRSTTTVTQIATITRFTTTTPLCRTGRK